jgi:hypothetical protein
MLHAASTDTCACCCPLLHFAVGLARSYLLAFEGNIRYSASTSAPTYLGDPSANVDVVVWFVDVLTACQQW